MGVFLDKLYETFALKKQPDRDIKPPKLMPDSHAEGAEGPYGNYDFIRQRVKSKVEDIARTRWQFERLWFHCVMYYIGNQWIKWDDQKREWRQRNLKRKWVPKPVTNRFATTINTIRGTISQARVEPSCWPASDQPLDIAAAEIAEQVIPVIDQEINADRVRELASAWMTLCADSFGFPYYDHSDDSLGTTNIPDERCMICGHIATPAEFEDSSSCPSCGIPAGLTEEAEPHSYPIGRMRVDVMSPLETYIRIDGRELRDLREFTRLRIYTKESVKARYPQMGPRAQSSLQTQTKQAQNYLRMIAYMTGTTQAIGRSEGDILGVFTHVELPSDEFPEGLCCVMADDETILEVGPSPWHEQKADPNTDETNKRYYLPLVQWGYETVPGRIYHRSPSFDLLSKQDQRNRLESLMELSVMKGVYNSWLLPTGSNITRLSGEPAQLIRYTLTGTGGAKPEVVTSEPFPQSVMMWLEKIDSDFEELGGTYDAMKGTTPKGVSAGYAIQMLTERSMGRFGPVFTNWSATWIELYRMLLCIFRANVTEPRIAKIKGDAGTWQMKQFYGADLSGAVDLKVEGGKEKPRTKIAEQAMVEAMINMGVLRPDADPIQAYKIADSFGMAHLIGQQAEDFRAAAKEWDLFLQGQEPVLMPDVDNDIIHLSDHTSRAKSDKFQEMYADTQKRPWAEIFLQHIRDHNFNVMRKQMMQTGGVPPEEPKADKRPVDSKGREVQDNTMKNNRKGGVATMGGGGENQHSA